MVNAPLYPPESGSHHLTARDCVHWLRTGRVQAEIFLWASRQAYNLLMMSISCAFLLEPIKELQEHFNSSLLK